MKSNLTGLSVGLLATLTLVTPALAAMTVTMTVSPAAGTVGRPVEVLLRTFAPVSDGVGALPMPTLAYPVASGLWNVLYPVPDYPFDVVATSGANERIAVPLTRDSIDSTLWRGVFTPTTTGQWIVAVRNFPRDEPGASASVTVSPGQDDPSNTTLGILAVGVALTVGLLLGRLTGRRAP